MTLQVFGVPGLPEIVPGSDLAAMILIAAAEAGDATDLFSIYADDAVIWHNHDNREQTVAENAVVLEKMHTWVRDRSYDDRRIQVFAVEASPWAISFSISRATYAGGVFGFATSATRSSRAEAHSPSFSRSWARVSRSAAVSGCRFASSSSSVTALRQLAGSGRLDRSAISRPRSSLATGSPTTRLACRICSACCRSR